VIFGDCVALYCEDSGIEGWEGGAGGVEDGFVRDIREQCVDSGESRGNVGPLRLPGHRVRA
jgi:hypothetical protein